MIYVNDLSVTAADGTEILKPVSFVLPTAASLFVVGESGSGKTSLLEVFAGVSPHFVADDSSLDGVSLRKPRGEVGTWKLGPDAAPGRGEDGGWRCLMAVQEARQAFSPYRRLRGQIVDARPWTQGVEFFERLAETLREMGLEADAVLDKYPHQLSDGMLKRVLLAGVLSVRPTLLLLDEPTAGIDPSRKWTVLESIRSRALQFIFATHDIGIVARCSEDYVLVLYHGEAVDFGPIGEVRLRPRHRYTRRLFATLQIDDGREA